MAFEEHQVGHYRLIHGDCRDVLGTFSTASIEACVTDPPYGVVLSTKTSDYRQSRFFDHGESLRASVGYLDTAAHVVGLIRTVMPEVLRVAQRTLIFCGPHLIFDYPRPAAIGCVYTPNGAGRSPWGFQCCHPILYYGKDPYLQHGLGSRPNSFRTEQPNREQIDHPCPKPLPWMLWAVQRMAFQEETVLDPFAGSFTTGVACLRLGRPFIGIEIEKRYWEIGCERLEEEAKQLTLFPWQVDVSRSNLPQLSLGLTGPGAVPDPPAVRS